MHNKVTTNTPLQRVRNILTSFDEAYKGSIFTSRKEFDSEITATKTIESKRELPKLLKKIEEIRIQVEGLYPIDPANPLTTRGYTHEELAHYLLERISTNARDMIAIREKVNDSKKRGDNWTIIKRMVATDIRDEVKSLDGKTQVHDTQVAIVAQGPEQRSQFDSSSQLRPCYRWANSGYCSFGKKCKFNHLDTERGSRGRSNERDYDHAYRSRSRSMLPEEWKKERNHDEKGYKKI
jgi:hypothetical protein